MKAKDKVRAVHPYAKAVRQKTNGGGAYWLIYPAWQAGMYIASGETEAKAWAAAAEKVKP